MAELEQRWWLHEVVKTMRLFEENFRPARDLSEVLSVLTSLGLLPSGQDDEVCIAVLQQAEALLKRWPIAADFVGAGLRELERLADADVR